MALLIGRLLTNKAHELSFLPNIKEPTLWIKAMGSFFAQRLLQRKPYFRNKSHYSDSPNTRDLCHKLITLLKRTLKIWNVRYNVKSFIISGILNYSSLQNNIEHDYNNNKKRPSIMSKLNNLPINYMYILVDYFPKYSILFKVICLSISLFLYLRMIRNIRKSTKWGAQICSLYYIEPPLRLSMQDYPVAATSNYIN